VAGLGVVAYIVQIDVHTSAVDELSIFEDWHSDDDGSDSTLRQTEKTLSAKRGAICEEIG
jgi:hypothetical protein